MSVDNYELRRIPSDYSYQWAIFLNNTKVGYLHYSPEGDRILGYVPNLKRHEYHLILDRAYNDMLDKILIG